MLGVYRDVLRYNILNCFVTSSHQELEAAQERLVQVNAERATTQDRLETMVEAYAKSLHAPKVVFCEANLFVPLTVKMPLCAMIANFELCAPGTTAAVERYAFDGWRHITGPAVHAGSTRRK